MSNKALVLREELVARRVIELPAETPEQVEYEEPIGPGPAEVPIDPEVLSGAEQKYRKVNMPPESVVTRTPMIKETLVTPVDVEAKTFWGFLEALGCIASPSPEYPITGGIKMKFYPGDDARLVLEANNQRVWAAASMKASGGDEAFEAVLPLQRTKNVIKRLSQSYSKITIGLGKDKIHIGNFSFPFYGRADHFPGKPRLDEALLSVSFATTYAKEIPERVFPAASAESEDIYGRGTTGVFIDLQRHVAVGTNSHRMHVLKLPLMHVEIEKQWKDIPQGVQIPIEVYQYLAAVEDREYTGFRLGRNKIMIGHADFGLITEPQNECFPEWEDATKLWPGSWSVGREVFLDAVKEASLILGAEEEPYIDFAFDLNGRSIAVVSASNGGARFERVVEASPSGDLVSFITVRLNAVYALDAIDACRGTTLRLGVARSMDYVTFRGDDNNFTGIVMPKARKQ